MNVDIGGGTSKIAICCRRARARSDRARRRRAPRRSRRRGVVTRLEDAGRLYAQAVGLDLAVGQKARRAEAARRSVRFMADRLFEVIESEATAEEHRKLFRLPPLSYRGKSRTR
jgi:hypothetical protein